MTKGAQILSSSDKLFLLELEPGFTLVKLHLAPAFTLVRSSKRRDILLSLRADHSSSAGT
jgi:hypothetical protein